MPLRTQHKGPAPKENLEFDIIDEALTLFKANVFFKNYEIKVNLMRCRNALNLTFKSEADRTLIYITLYITECLKKIQKVSNKLARSGRVNNAKCNSRFLTLVSLVSSPWLSRANFESLMCIMTH